MQAMLPGADHFLQFDLDPGDYVLVCFVPSPDGTPHFMQGMVATVTVT
jgi:hypothetical protein